MIFWAFPEGIEEVMGRHWMCVGCKQCALNSSGGLGGDIG
jgi:hypothetical protein